MVIQFTNDKCSEDQWQTVDLSSLSRDLRRMLSVQVREFVHHIEDTQADISQVDPPSIVPLFGCYVEAA